MADKDDRSLNVAAGKYPVVGAVDRDGQVKSAGIIFDAVDPQSGKLKNVVEFRQPDELAKMARSGKLELAEGIVMSMLGVAQERERLLHGEKQAFDVDVEGLVILLFGDGAKRSEMA